MTGLYKPTNQAGQPLNTLYAQDIAQFINSLTGQMDVGGLSLLGPVTDPTAFTPAITLSTGGLTGAYKWAFYWITGIQDGVGGNHIVGRTLMGTPTTTQNPSSQRATVDISSAGAQPTGVIGWGVCRTKAGGSTYYLVPNSEQFLSGAGTLASTYVDNAADGTLVTTVQAVNTTGSTIGLPAFTSLPSSPYNGQIVPFVADATNGIVWQFRYNSGDVSGYPWEFFGGGSMWSEIATTETTNSTSYTDLSTVGPTLIVPRAGEYEILEVGTIGVNSLNTGSLQQWSGSIAAKLGAAAAADAERAIFMAVASGAEVFSSVSRTIHRTLTAGETIKLQYKVNSGTSEFSNRGLFIRPLRVA